MEQATKYLRHKFPGQKPGEQIQALVRKHWIIDVKVAAIFFVLGVIPFAISVVLAVLFWDGTFNDTFALTSLTLWAYMLAVTAFAYMSWLKEELDVIIVTNERIVSHDQIDLFHRQIAETNIAQVQDVKGVEEGVLGNIFHFGMLEIQTAAKDIIFVIRHVNTPYESAREILDIRDRYIDKEKFEKRSSSHADEEISQVYNI